MLVLCDGDKYIDFLPLTFTRPISEFLIGIGSIRSKWEAWCDQEIAVLTQPYLQSIFPAPPAGIHTWISANIIPVPDLVKFIQDCPPRSTLYYQDKAIGHTEITYEEYQTENLLLHPIQIPPNIKCITIHRLWDLFTLNSQVMNADFIHFTNGKKSADLADNNKILGDQVFLEEGAKINCAIVNALTGPIYLATGAEIQEGAMIRGGLYLGPESTVKMGAKLYGTTSVGKACKIGGEITNSIFHDYSNKGHEGYIGNSVIGSWCNFGADTNSSNLKNTYDTINCYDYRSGKMINSGQQFLGLLMGDHSKTGINTMLNTGTVIGVNCNIYGSGFPPNYIPSFSWGGTDELQTYRLEKAIETAYKVMARRDVLMTKNDRLVFQYLFENRHTPIID